MRKQKEPILTVLLAVSAITVSILIPTPAYAKQQSAFSIATLREIIDPLNNNSEK